MELGQEKNKLKEKITQYCGFKICNELYAIDVLSVQEIIRALPMTPVPLSHPCIRGLINLRGQIVTSIDLRLLFNLEKRPEDTQYMNVIVRSADGLTALMVDEILDVMDLSNDTFEGTPDTLNPELKKYVKGVHKLEGHLLILLNLERILAFGE